MKVTVEKRENEDESERWGRMKVRLEKRESENEGEREA
jgi:hypothetical protein